MQGNKKLNVYVITSGIQKELGPPKRYRPPPPSP